MKHVVVLLSLAAMLAGCAYRPPSLSGLEFETLHLPQPVPGRDWSVVAERKEEESVKRWSRTGGALLLSVRRSRELPSPDAFRRESDVGAQGEPLLAFRSSVLEEGELNGYPMVLWQTAASLPGGGKTGSLLLYIQGNDAAYSLERRWDGTPVPEAELRRWIAYLLGVTVCDPRMAEHPCP